MIGTFLLSNHTVFASRREVLHSFRDGIYHFGPGPLSSESEFPGRLKQEQEVARK